MRSLTEIYADMLARGVLEDDSAQAACVIAFERLRREIALWSRIDWVARFLRRPRYAPRGIYIYGDVGRGKSMLMDMFYQSLTLRARRRVHFHEFMQEVHQRIFVYRAQNPDAGAPIAHIAADIARTTRVLCFDEFHVSNIADASILGRLFEHLFLRHVVVVATSNQSPDMLYANGLNRDRFLSAIALIKRHLDVLVLSAERDYRLARLMGHPVWFTPLGVDSHMAMDARFVALTGGDSPQAVRLDVSGRDFLLPTCVQGVARLSFAQACEAARGAGDYLALAQNFHTLLLDNIPCFTMAHRDAAARFTVLIDALYEHKVKLVASAQTSPDKLYAKLDRRADVSFVRVRSRLAEMQSQDYLVQAHKTR